jgi:molybdenum cofactor biosynthesis protein A
MKDPLVDSHGRVHDYLRVSLIEKCNLRCRYCMPENPDWTPKEDLCTTEELLQLIDQFMEFGIKKVRLTGGEPLVRKDVDVILEHLSGYDAELSMTTNGILADRYLSLLKKYGVNKLNVSLDTLKPDKFAMITRRSGFEKVISNIHLLVNEGFNVKVNAVIMRGMNDGELIDFVEWTKEVPITVRFIEFMPFDGNRWDDEKMVPIAEMRERISETYPFEKLQDGPHDTTKHYRVPGFAGKFGIISSMTEHFCGSCNRLRLLANGALKNCLFSTDETDLLTPLRKGEELEPIIRRVIWDKKARHAGRFEIAKQENRSMVTIGG